MYRAEAESALEGMAGMPVGRNRARISWGRSPATRRAVDPATAAAMAAAAAAQQQALSGFGGAAAGGAGAYYAAQQAAMMQAAAAAAATQQQAQAQAALLVAAEGDGFGYADNVPAVNEDFIGRQAVVIAQPWRVYSQFAGHGVL
jgi:hypothetical protein